MRTKAQISNIKTGLDTGDAAFPLAFQALGDPGKFKIFKLLMNNHELCVTDIANIFGISVSAASQQLRVLERLGLLSRTRMGQVVCHEINTDNQVVKQLVKLLNLARIPRRRRGRIEINIRG